MGVLNYKKISALTAIITLIVITTIIQIGSDSKPSIAPGTSAQQPQSTTSPLSKKQPDTSSRKQETTSTVRSNQTTPTPTVSSESIIVGDTVYPNRTYRASIAVNDPYGTQWWTTQTGLPQAWDTPTTSNVTIAVIDGGFALDHEDLAGRWKSNSAETGSTTTQGASDYNCTRQGIPIQASCNNIDDDRNGVTDDETGSAVKENASFLNCSDQGKAIDKSCNRIDDDNNGYIDDIRGWDFASGDPSVQAGEINPDSTVAFHGTAVTSMAGANGNNGLGIAGVNWNAKIMPIQALSDDGSGDTYSVSRAIRYAADQGANIINLSLGSAQEDSYMRQAIAYAIERGAVVVAASGNDGCNCISYPARYPEVLAVGSSNSSGSADSFSNYGSTLDILAPGSNLIVASWGKTNAQTQYRGGIAGTSFAAPYVSGLLATARSVEPNATWGQLITQVTATTNHSGLNATSPRTDTVGFGYIRADNFVSRLLDTTPQQTRYYFNVSKTDVLGSDTFSQCRTDELPTATLYQISGSNGTTFTTSEYDMYKRLRNGATLQSSRYVCAPLPTDTGETIRSMQTGNELFNIQK